MKKTQDVFTIKNGAVRLIDSGGYKTTGDAVILAECINAKSGTVLDVGIGAGGVALCMLDECPKLKVTGIDISEDMIGDAWANAVLNNRDIELLSADIFKWKTNRQFDFVVTNPPYFSGTPRKDGAHHNVDIYKWTAASAKRVRPRGYFYAIAGVDVMDKVIAALHDAKCGGITLKLIGRSPGGKLGAQNGIERVVISARKNVKTPARILP